MAGARIAGQEHQGCMDGALAGIRVLDFTTLLPGPLATLMLAAAGAEVLKIERPGGEDMRRFPPLQEGGSAAFEVLNHRKTSLFLDLKDPAAVAALTPHIRAVDIVVEQFRPGVMARLGLGYEAMRALNPRLIYCAISGYGQEGPRAGEAGHDLNYQARAGLLSLSPGTTAAPTVPPALIADIGGGSLPAVINILLALRRRDLTGEGCFLDIAMADTLATFAWHAVLQQRAGVGDPIGGEGFFTGGLARYRLYATSDQRFLAVGALEEKFWTTFCDAVGLDQTLRDDLTYPRPTIAVLSGLIGAKPSDYWRSLLEPLDCCCCIVASMAEAMADPHFKVRGLFQEGQGAYVPIAPALRG